MKKLHLAYYQMIAADDRWQEQLVKTWGPHHAVEARYDNRKNNTNELMPLWKEREKARTRYFQLVDQLKGAGSHEKTT